MCYSYQESSRVMVSRHQIYGMHQAEDTERLGKRHTQRAWSEANTIPVASLYTLSISIRVASRVSLAPFEFLAIVRKPIERVMTTTLAPARKQ